MNLDPKATIASQYANSPTIVQMVDNYHQPIDPSGDFQNFYDFVWNIDTAQGFGLDIWGRILGLQRQLTIVPIFGFPNPAGPYSMTDDQYRRALLVKALTNISDGSAPSINREMMLLSDGRGNAFVEPVANMVVRYTHFFPLEPYEHALVESKRWLGLPAGVDTVEQVTINPYFGFSEADSWDTFDQAVFASY